MVEGEVRAEVEVGEVGGFMGMGMEEEGLGVGLGVGVLGVEMKGVVW